MERYMSARPCPTCEGKRLRKEALAVTITDLNIVDVSGHQSVWIEPALGATCRRRSDEDAPQGHRLAQRRRRADLPETVPPLDPSASTPSPARFSRNCARGCASCTTWGWTT
jgi:hypothetical protein